MKFIIRWIVAIAAVFLIGIAPVYVLAESTAHWHPPFRLGLAVLSPVMGVILLKRFQHFRAEALAKKRTPEL